jgi:hypothetical protein
MVMSRDQTVGQSQNIKTGNSSFERVVVQIFWNNLNKSKFYLGRNEEQKEVRECLLSFSAESFVLQLAIQNIKNKIYRTIILPVVLYGCETWSHKLRKECRLRCFRIVC